MITIIYQTSNGYRCHCCRQTFTNWLDAETEEEAISQCISISKSEDGDFEVLAVRGSTDNSDLESRINEALNQTTRR